MSGKGIMALIGLAILSFSAYAQRQRDNNQRQRVNNQRQRVNNLTGQVLDSETGNPLDEKAPPKEPNVKSIRTSKWKLIFNEYNDTKELYNLLLDPDENKNLIGTDIEIEKKLWEELRHYINKRD